MRGNMILGMPTLIELTDLEQTMDLCKELGFSFVELNMNLPQYQLEEIEKIEMLSKWKDKYQLFYTIHLDENLNIADFNPLVSKAYLNTVARTIEVAKMLDVPILNMHMNQGVYFTLPSQKVYLFDQYKDSYLEHILQFRTMCENKIGASNLRICIENTDGFRNYEKEAIELLLQSSVFALTWDIGHSNACHNVDEEFIMKHEEKLAHFHIHDGDHALNHMALGTGEIDLKSRFEIAQRDNCRCVVETKTVAALKESSQWLQKMGF